MTQSESSKPRPADKGKRRLSRRARKTLLLVVLVGVLLAGVAYYYWSKRTVLDEQIVKETGFTVYAPKDPPAGYELNEDSVKSDSGTVSYVFDGVLTDKSITVTVQPKPSGFNMSQMIDKGSIQSKAVASGTLYDLSAGGTSQHLLDTGDSLVFMTSSESIDTATINALAEDLVKQN